MSSSRTSLTHTHTHTHRVQGFPLLFNKTELRLTGRLHKLSRKHVQLSTAHPIWQQQICSQAFESTLKASCQTLGASQADLAHQISVCVSLSAHQIQGCRRVIRRYNLYPTIQANPGKYVSACSSAVCSFVRDHTRLPGVHPNNLPPQRTVVVLFPSRRCMTLHIRCNLRYHCLPHVQATMDRRLSYAANSRWKAFVAPGTPHLSCKPPRDMTILTAKNCKLCTIDMYSFYRSKSTSTCRSKSTELLLMPKGLNVSQGKSG